MKLIREEVWDESVLFKTGTTTSFRNVSLRFFFAFISLSLCVTIKAEILR